MEPIQSTAGAIPVLNEKGIRHSKIQKSPLLAYY